ncbi:unnamed protein product [Nesidiocoris tenuis]|uniref:Uncharacterized protein n=1 Tax=Nesidiocoris tenuis TaxID=355587 RepID=A0A6H5GDX2_9HEMI|nr:unnamed protein product [Nesidiocoris tenuis]
MKGKGVPSGSLYAQSNNVIVEMRRENQLELNKVPPTAPTCRPGDTRSRASSQPLHLQSNPHLQPVDHLRNCLQKETFYGTADLPVTIVPTLSHFQSLRRNTRVDEPCTAWRASATKRRLRCTLRDRFGHESQDSSSPLQQHQQQNSRNVGRSRSWACTSFPSLYQHRTCKPMAQPEPLISNCPQPYHERSNIGNVPTELDRIRTVTHLYWKGAESSAIMDFPCWSHEPVKCQFGIKTPNLGSSRIGTIVCGAWSINMSVGVDTTSSCSEADIFGCGVKFLYCHNQDPNVDELLNLLYMDTTTHKYLSYPGDRTTAPPPYFVKGDHSPNSTVQLGAEVTLHCKVNDLAEHTTKKKAFRTCDIGLQCRFSIEETSDLVVVLTSFEESDLAESYRSLINLHAMARPLLINITFSLLTSFWFTGVHHVNSKTLAFSPSMITISSRNQHCRRARPPYQE